MNKMNKTSIRIGLALLLILPAFQVSAATRSLSLSETLYAWRAGANRVMLMPNGRCSRAAVVCANQLVSLKSKA